MTIAHITNGEAGSSVRTKLNAVIDDVNAGPVGGTVPLPFVGNAPKTGWTRPALNVGGPDGFNAWLNQGGQLNAGIVLQGFAPPAGEGYSVGDVSTLAGGTGTPATIKITAVGVGSATLVSPGSGGTPGPAQVIGTTGSAIGGNFFVLDVTIGILGTITSIDDISGLGTYSVPPTNLSNEPVADDSGSGIGGARVSITMTGALAVPVTLGDYTVSPTTPVGESSSTGGGTGAQWYIYIAPGGQRATADDLTGGLPLLISSPFIPDPPTGALPQGLLKDAPAGPSWTIEVGEVAITNWSKSAAIDALTPWWPIILYETATGNTVALVWSGNGGLSVVHWTAGGSVTTVSETGMGFQQPSYFQWFRIDNDGTTLTFQASFEGLAWLDIYSEAVDAFLGSIDKVGFGADLAEMSGSTPSALATQNSGLWQWLET